MKRGNVAWVRLPRPKGKPRREQVGRRPAVIVQNEPALSRMPTVVVVPLTSKQKALQFSSTFLITPSRTNGLNEPSVALVFQICAVDRSWIEEPVGELSTEDLSKLDNSIRSLLKLAISDYDQ